MRIGIAFSTALLTAFLIGPTFRAEAQAVANAELHGTVQDGSGAVVPGAKVTATQTDTGRVQSTTSGNDGNFSLPTLPVGAYKLDVTATGFKGYTQSGITLQVGSNVQVNVSLALGSVSEHVEVSADAVMVQTQDTSVSQVIDQRRIVDLPLNGRQATDLILLSGGAAQPPNSTRVITTHDYPTAVGISVAGGQINGNNYLLDGADHNDSHSNVNLPFPFPDALQEFSVQTAGISSRYGLHPGSVVNVVTRSGTNKIHGNLFEFVRNGKFNARNFFALSQDSLKRNQFGGTIGGPIRHDKIFLFSGFQATRERTAPPQTTSFIPNAAVLTGDFSALEQSTTAGGCVTGAARQLYNPATGAAYANNFIDPTTFNPAAVNLIKQLPTAKADRCGKIVYAIPNPNNENQYVGKVDWTVSQRHSTFGRYFIDDYSNPGIDTTNNLLLSTRSGLVQRAQSVVLGDQFSITPNLINAFHVGFVRLAVNRAQPPGMPSPNKLGVTMYNAITNFIDLAVTSHFSVGGGSNAPASFIRNQWQIADDIDLIKGKSHYSFGGEWITGQMDENNIQYANGEFSFDGSRTKNSTVANSGDALADFLLGSIHTVIDSNVARVDLRQKYLGFYVEDGIQLSKRLNVHVGVRWEPALPEHDALARGNHFDMAAFTAGTRTSLYNNAPPGLFFFGDKGIPKSYANGSYKGFAPRIGFAFDPTGEGKESIRASYGIFFDSPESFMIRDFGIAAPWGNAITLTNPAGGLSNPVTGYTFPTPIPPTATAIFPTQGTYINMPLNLHHIYMQQYNLSLQHQFTSNWLFSVDYIGNRGMHMRSGVEQNPGIYIPGSSASLATRRRLSQINPITGAFYSSISYMDDGVNTYYNGVLTKAEHRFSNHFTVLSAYTWSHCLQTAEPLGNRLSGSNESNPFKQGADFGACDYDLRHNWTNSVVLQGPKFGKHLTEEIAGGWQLSFNLVVRSGFPFNPVTGTDQSQSGVGLDRPDLTGVNPYVRNKQTLAWITPTAFTPNAAGTFGTARYNSLRAPGYLNSDATLEKNFRITESQRLDFRFEFFNVFNHTNLLAPVATRSSSVFGVIQTSNPARIIQMAGKYYF
ncbi:MAG TPA: carboxypeptidase-like regulatory domain-containing protein [Acidobacteriaceae bacterium]